MLPLLGVLAFGATYIAARAQKPIPLTSTYIAGQTSTVSTLSFQLSATTSTTKAVANGKFTSYSLPHGSFDFVKGSDGAFWYIVPSANVIGRLNTNGTIKEYALPTVGYYPDNITSGPDGALWFSYRYNYTGAPSQYTCEIARLTTTGALTIFQISADRSGFIDSLTSGSDGAIWFEYSGSTEVGFISKTGVVTAKPSSLSNCQQTGAMGEATCRANWLTTDGSLRNPWVPS